MALGTGHLALVEHRSRNDFRGVRGFPPAAMANEVSIAKEKGPIQVYLNRAFEVGDDLLSRVAARIGGRGLTAEFGMGSGVSRDL